jgi:hypothetical protein
MQSFPADTGAWWRQPRATGSSRALSSAWRPLLAIKKEHIKKDHITDASKG